MYENGKITNVWLNDVGSELIADALSGSSTLVIDDALDFNLKGGSLRLISDTITLDITYAGADFDSNILTTSVPLSNTFPAGTQVLVLPIGQQMKAMIDLDDSDEGVSAIIPSGMDAQVDTGIREESEQEAVLISDESGRWEVANIDDQRSVVLGSQVTGDGLPPALPTAPPAISPAVVVTGTTASLIAHTEDVAAGTIIEYHISTTDGFTPTLGGPTKFTATEATVALIDAMPDGTPFTTDGQYFVRTIAYNSLGSAAPSAQSPAALNMENVDEFVTAKLVAAFIQAGKISVGQFTLDAVGMRVNRPGGGYVFNFPFSGTDTLEITAAVTAVSLNVLNALTIQGNGQLYGTLLMSNGIVAPTNQPGVSRAWPSNLTNNGDGSTDVSAIYSGLIVNPANSNQFVECFNYLGMGVRYLDRVTGNWGGDLALGSWKDHFYPNGGICYLSNSYYVIGSDSNRSGDYYIYKFHYTTGAKQAEIRLGDIYTFQGADPRLFTDGTDISFAFINSSKDLRVKRFDAGLSGQLSNTVLPGVFPGRYHIGDVVYGNFDGIGIRAYISMRGANNVLCYNPSGWSRDSAYDFQRASTVQGMCYDAVGAQMVSIDSTGIMYRYGKYPVDKAIIAKYAWLDPNATGSTHETQPGPTKSYTLPARTYLNLQAVEPPDYQNTDPLNVDKANQVAMYATDDGGSTWRKQIYSADPWGASYPTLAGLTTGTPKVTNEFLTSTVATPGIFKSTATDAGVDGMNEIVHMKGSGTFRFGNYSGLRHYGCRQQSSSQSIPNASGTVVAFGASKETTTGLSWDNTNGRFVAAKPGIYHVVLMLQWGTTSSTGRRQAMIYKNGSAYAISETTGSAVTGNAPNTLVTADIPLAVGDYVDARAYHNGGAALLVNDGIDGNRHYFSCAFVAT